MMKHTVAFMVLLCLGIMGCNSVGPYTAKVYRLDEAAYMINLSTWVGSENGMSSSNEKMMRVVEKTVQSELIQRGLTSNKCVFIEVTPYQGGNLVLTFLAGSGPSFERWTSMPKSDFDRELRRRLPLDLILTFEGVLGREARFSPDAPPVTSP